MILLYWAIAIPVLAVLWRLFVKGYVINWIELLKALPGIIFDSTHGLYMGIRDLLRPRRYWTPVNPNITDEHDIYE